MCDDVDCMPFIHEWKALFALSWNKWKIFIELLTVSIESIFTLALKWRRIPLSLRCTVCTLCWFSLPWLRLTLRILCIFMRSFMNCLHVRGFCTVMVFVMSNECGSYKVNRPFSTLWTFVYSLQCTYIAEAWKSIPCHIVSIDIAVAIVFVCVCVRVSCVVFPWAIFPCSGILLV